MKLDEWLHQERISGAELARRVGVHETTITGVRTGRQYPSVKLAKRIEAATAGAVAWAELVDRPVDAAV